MASTSGKDFVSADSIVWAEAQPRSEVCLGFPSTHVQHHFTDERLSDHHIHAVDPRQIHARDALQFSGEVEVWIILTFHLPFLPGQFFLCRWRDSIGKSSQVFL